MHRLETPETDPHRQLRTRLTEFGVLAWRLSADGHVLEPPAAQGVLSTWLCNQCLLERLESLISATGAGETVRRVKLFQGCEVMLLPVRIRRRVSEWTVAMFLTPEVLSAGEFGQGCARVHVDPVAVLKAVRPIATFSEIEIDRLAQVLPAMAHDLEQHQRDQAALAGFTATLSEAYEQIELTHGLAGRMRNLEGPDGFLRSALDGVDGATGFGWVALYTDCLPGHSTSDGPTLLHAGREAVTGEGVRALLDTDPFGGASADEAVILSDIRVEHLVGGPDQIVAYPIHRGPQLVGVLIAGDKHGEDPQVSTYDTRVIDTVGAFVRSYLEIAWLLHERQEMFLGSLRAITAALDAKDSYTRGHSERVAHLAALLAREAGLSEEQIERVHIAGLMHDVGKIGVPEEVLRKPGRLTDEEFDQIKRHPTIGREILGGISQLSDIIPGVLWHHERWDGRGYPDGLTGEQTPVIARLLAVADSFDAMSSNRSYRDAKPRETVLAEIERVAGSQLDPELARLFLTLDLTEYDELVARHMPQERHHGRLAA